MSERIEKILSDILLLLKKGREGGVQIFPRYCEAFTTSMPDILIEIPYYPREVISALTGKQYTTFYNVDVNIYLHSYRPHVERHKIKHDIEQKLREILSTIDPNDIHYIIVELKKAPYSLDPTLNLNPNATRPFNPILP